MIPIMSDHRLLILACSQKKKAGSKLMPASERYDGPAFQVLRKFFVKCPAEASKLDTRILSAKFGLIPATQPIPCYDQLMTLSRATVLNPKVLAELRSIFARRKYRMLLINVGQDYRLALAGYESLMPSGLEVTQASGTSGRRQTLLRDWLRGEPQPPMQIASPGRARIRGVELLLTPE